MERPFGRVPAVPIPLAREEGELGLYRRIDSGGAQRRDADLVYGLQLRLGISAFTRHWLAGRPAV